jgi:hypothetical protein
MCDTLQGLPGARALFRAWLNWLVSLKSLPLSHLECSGSEPRRKCWCHNQTTL